MGGQPGHRPGLLPRYALRSIAIREIDRVEVDVGPGGGDDLDCRPTAGGFGTRASTDIDVLNTAPPLSDVENFGWRAAELGSGARRIGCDATNLDEVPVRCW